LLVVAIANLNPAQPLAKRNPARRAPVAEW
jgi:hypothetical protein